MRKGLGGAILVLPSIKELKKYSKMRERNKNRFISGRLFMEYGRKVHAENLKLKLHPHNTFDFLEFSYEDLLLRPILEDDCARAFKRSNSETVHYDGLETKTTY